MVAINLPEIILVFNSTFLTGPQSSNYYVMYGWRFLTSYFRFVFLAFLFFILLLLTTYNTVEKTGLCDTQSEETGLLDTQWRKLGGVTHIWRKLSCVTHIQRKLGWVTHIRRKLGCDTPKGEN